MLLKPINVVPFLSPALFAPRPLSTLRSLPRRRITNGPVIAMAQDQPIYSAGAVFNAFEELKHDLSLVPSAPDQSIARHRFPDDCEAALNAQINVEYNVSYVYHAMFAYFDRDNVALKGIAKFFKECSEESREDAETLMEYQNKRGGRVKLQSMMMPLSEFNHYEKGDALHAMELALSFEKLTNDKLLNLHAIAVQCNDVQLRNFVENEFLEVEIEAIKKISEYIAQLRRVGKGHGVWHFDQVLLGEGDIAA